MEGSLTRAEFDVLAALAEGLPHAAGGEALVRLEEHSLVSAGAVTDAGFEALEPYRVARAVVTAAGFGKRMVPVTLERPKPLVRVNGKRIVSKIVVDMKESKLDENGFGRLVLKSYTPKGKLKGRFIGEADVAECGYLYRGEFVNVNGGTAEFLFCEV